MDTKVCRKCAIEKPKIEFHFSNREKGYLCYICKECSKVAGREFYHANTKTRDKVKARSRAWSKANPRPTEQQRRHSLKSKYGMTEADYQAMLANQGGKCVICQGADPGRQTGKWATGRFHIDHCHETGRIRGLACHICNLRLGAYERLMKDRGHEWLQAYLTG